MNRTPQKSKKGNGGFLLSMALGAALAAATGYYVQHKDEVDKEAKKQFAILAKRFKQTRKQVEQRVKEVWGDVSEEAIHRYMDVRGAVLEALHDEALTRTGVLIEKNYNATVDRILATAIKTGVLNKESQKKLKDIFTMDWKDIQKVLKTGAKVVKNLAKKAPKVTESAVKKAAKSAKKTMNKAKMSKAVLKAAPKKAVSKAKKVVKKASARSKKKK